MILIWSKIAQVMRETVFPQKSPPNLEELQLRPLNLGAVPKIAESAKIPLT